MEKIIEFRKYPLDMILDKLLLDKTTGKRIIWATDGYSEYGEKYCDRYEITSGALIGINPVLIQPRAFKALETQQQRTKSKAEVFTPSWIVNKMVNHLDEEWFGRSDVFNIADNQTWQSKTEKIDFGKKKWKDYVDRTVLEITCGEAPFIVSRYNASTGEIIPIEDRIGILDRKLRVVTENTDNEEDWVKWAQRAFESVYGYEYQGDNLLIGRINLLMTFVDYYQHIWGKEVGKKLLTTITNIITWNFWQMDGLNGTVPLGVPQPMVEQMTLFDIEEEKEEKAPLCHVRKWRAKKTILYKEIERNEGNDMGKKKWDIVIGNPPYQDESVGDQKTFTPPVYHKFLEEAYKVADKVEMIHPARFLFNGGRTPAKWNEKMLNDRHLKVLYYEADSKKVFPNTEIKGGVAITYRDSKADFEPIEIFTVWPELNRIRSKVSKKHEKSLSEIIYSGYAYKLNDLFYREYPEEAAKLTLPHIIETNTMDKLSSVFKPKEEVSCKNVIAIYGLSKLKRTVKYIDDKYINRPDNLNKYKVILPEANGAGKFGEVLSLPFVSGPMEGYNRSFISIGSFNSSDEADACLKYIKTKFCRSLLGVLKITQHTKSKVWKYVPIQDFTTKSDIYWSKSISEIDQQLYKKYGLSPEEIDFIETHVKEMD